jgi:glycosyltransferase involved in cell wall biosynthesis
MKALVCLPTYNEINSIDAMTDRIRALGLDLFLCDQDSTDGTIERARECGIPIYRHDGFGKGWGVREALSVARELGYDVLVMIDCDCTYFPEDIPALLSGMADRDMVVGVRRMKDVQFSHRLVNRLHTGLLNRLFGCRFRDINSGLRAMRVEKFAGALDAEGFDIEAEITAKAARNAWPVGEVPVRYGARVGRSKIRARDTFRIIRRIWNERFKEKRISSRSAS